MEEKILEQNKKINSGRQFNLDCVKFFAIFFMITIHVYEQLGQYDFRQVAPTGFFRNFVEFAGGPLAAPVFMFCMGIAMVYTKHSQAEDFIKRGCKLALMGFALTFCRSTFLELIGNMFLGMNFSFEELMSSFLNIDILQFAGMTFIFVGIMKKLRLKSSYMLILAFLFQSVGIFALYIKIPNIVPRNLLGLLLPTGSDVAFPLTLWFIYPVAGLVFGELLQKVTDKNKFYKKILLLGASVFVVVTVWMIYFGKNIKEIYALANRGYYQQTVLSAFWILPIVLFELALFHFILKKIEKTKLGKFISFCSKKLNTIYIIQWLIIAYMVAFVTATGAWHKLQGGEIIVVAIAVVALAIAIVALWGKIRGGRKKEFSAK